ncbi:MAG TPA: gamma-glutamyltransferase, partial [Promineifilum sp.]|nr:gamma-glutamyltransferase [Promineifilum sp.]
QPWSSFGVMGGFMQPQGHLQVGINLVEFKMEPQAALDAPRFNWLEGLEVALEPGIGKAVRDDLVRRGHVFHPMNEPLFFGGGQIILRDRESGVYIGGAEPRNDGAVVGW